MGEIKGFVISLVTAAVFSSVIEGFVPESGSGSGVKRYLHYLVSLAILLTLISPLRGLSNSLTRDLRGAGAATSGLSSFDFDSVQAAARVNSITALHIRRSVAVKFGLSEDRVSAEFFGSELRLTMPAKFGLFASDVKDFVRSGWAVESEVIFCE